MKDNTDETAIDMPKMKKIGGRRRLPGWPELNHVQWALLQFITALDADAYGGALLDHVNRQSAEKVDQAHVYVTLQRMAKRGLIAVRERRSVSGSPPLKVWQLTAAGKTAVRQYVAFCRQVVAITDETTLARSVLEQGSGREGARRARDCGEATDPPAKGEAKATMVAALTGLVEEPEDLKVVQLKTRRARSS